MYIGSIKMLSTRQVATLGLRAFSNLRPPYKGKIPDGSLLAPLKSNSKIMYAHHLDDEPEYRRFLREDLPIDIIQDVPTECQTAESVVDLMVYNLPLFPPSWTYIPELIYITVVPKAKQTPEGFKKARLLRACFDVRYTGFAILDDIMDKSDKRQGKPTWKHVAPNGISGALCGGMLLNQMPYYILKKHFSNEPLYQRMVDTMIQADFHGMVGCVMDVYGQGGSQDKNLDPAMVITDWKAGSIISMQAVLGMHYVGIDDPALEKKVAVFQNIVGEFFQSWDDFVDYYNTPVETGKNSLDFANGSTTWASGTAMKLFNEEQKRIFHENYGSPDPEKHEIVRKLYDEVNMAEAYVQYLKERSKVCHNLIKEMNHPGIQAAMTSLLEWMVGDLYLQK